MEPVLDTGSSVLGDSMMLTDRDDRKAPQAKTAPQADPDHFSQEDRGFLLPSPSGTAYLVKQGP